MRVKLDFHEEEIDYDGLKITFRLLKKHIERVLPDYIKEFQIFKTFNSRTGNIDRKYAWDSIFYNLRDNGKLEKIIKSIINER